MSDAIRQSIHPTSVVAPGARIGSDSEIGPYAVIESDVEIGDHCRIDAHAVIKRYTRLGDATRVHEHAVLGGEPQDFQYQGKPSQLLIGKDNIIREGVTIHRSSREAGATTIGSGNYLMAYSHVAHDCILGDRIVLANTVLLAGHVEVEDDVFLAGGAAVHQFCRLGRHAIIGGNAKVTQDVLPFSLTDGHPARLRSLNVVGLKRAGIPTRDLKEAFRIVSGPGLLADKLERLRDLESDHVAHLVSFIEGSTRGFCRSAE